MKTIYLILSVILSLGLLSCGDEPIGKYIIDTGTQLYVLDEDGNDLLDLGKHYEKSIDLNKVKMVYLIDGKEISYSYPSPEGHGFSLYPPQGEERRYRLSMFLNSATTTATTLMRWNDTDSDTFEAEFHKNKTQIICTSLKLNGKLVWSVEGGGDGQRLITIVK